MGLQLTPTQAIDAFYELGLTERINDMFTKMGMAEKGFAVATGQYMARRDPETGEVIEGTGMGEMTLFVDRETGLHFSIHRQDGPTPGKVFYDEKDGVYKASDGASKKLEISDRNFPGVTQALNEIVYAFTPNLED